MPPRLRLLLATQSATSMYVAGVHAKRHHPHANSTRVPAHFYQQGMRSHVQHHRTSYSCWRKQGFLEREVHHRHPQKPCWQTDHQYSLNYLTKRRLLERTVHHRHPQRPCWQTNRQYSLNHLTRKSNLEHSYPHHECRPSAAEHLAQR